MPSLCPEPVYDPDTRLISLSTAELLLVGTLRLCARRSPETRGTDDDWSRGLVAAGLGDHGVPAFRSFLRIFATAALRPFEVRGQCCRVLGKDEARLLQVVSLLQRRETGAARQVLGDWLPPTAARLAVAPGREFATALLAAGLVIPVRHAEAAGILRAVNFHADRGLVLVQ